MAGQIDISPDGASLLISFPYRPDLVEVVKTLPGRRWDRGSKTWKVPVDQVELCVRTFMGHGFHLSPEVATALASGGQSRDLGTMQLDAVDQVAPALSVSQLNLRVAEVLHTHFDERVWIVGEIQGYKAKGRSRHRYFELVERSDDELDDKEGQPHAVVETVLFESNMQFVNKRLRQAAQQFQLEDGLKVRVRGKVDLYQPRGRYQFVVDDIDPNYTLGELVVRREKILAELDKAGLRERNKELEMPLVPLRIALVTSFESDAYNDFIQTLAQSGFNFLVTIFDTFVQGDGLKPSVLEALSMIEDTTDDYDLMVITRGGGSRSELGSWDDLDVATAVASHPNKAVVGIGHERDQCALDALCTSVKTPTAAAELLVDRARAYQEQVEDTMIEIDRRARRALREELGDLSRRARTLGHAVRAGLAEARSRLTRAGERARHETQRALRDCEKTLVHRAATIERVGSHRLDREGMVLATAARRLSGACRISVAREGERLAGREARTRAVDPVQTLRRGFAIVRSASGTALRSVVGATKGDAVTAHLADGTLTAQIQSIQTQDSNTDGKRSTD